MFWDVFLSLCSQHGKKPNPVAAELGFSSGSVTAWKNGRVPKDESLRKIASYFDVSVGYLLGYETERPAASDTAAGSPAKQRFLLLAEQLDESDLMQLSEYMEYLLAKRKRDTPS